MILRSFHGRLAAVSVLLALMVTPTATAQTLQRPSAIRHDIHHDVSQPLSELIRRAAPMQNEEREAEPWRTIPLPQGFSPMTEDPVLQHETLGNSPAISKSFEGMGSGMNGFVVYFAPPDTNGAVGVTQYVQWVNAEFAVFNKSTGAVVAGPTAGNVLWSGFGGGCETNNDGDPVVQYDKLANRWVMSQFSISTTPYLQCLAVSTSSDATGTWYRYAFQYSNFDDYPKMGVWPDAYYETFNMFSGNSFLGSDACAYSRAAMLNGQAATQVCFQQGATVGSLLPADLDGSTPPPAGAPNYMLTFGANTLNLYRFHVDFNTPANSTFLGPTVLSVAAFSPLCGGGRSCVPQSGTTTQLDSLADRLMYRFAYRNLGDHESLLVNQTVTANGGSGVRWYEIRSPGSSPTVAQQGTYAPDSNYRWMGSIAMDHAGDIAVGYSVSGSSLYPSLAMAGRVPTDTAGTLEAETTVVSGGGSQTGGLTRWGDYSGMSLDPTDDCTFWFTSEYIASTGVWNWHTRVASFKFPACDAGGGGDVTLLPASLSFPSTQVGSSSSSQPLTLSNQQATALTIGSIIATGDFSQSNDCGASLAAGNSCTITVTFQPSIGRRTDGRGHGDRQRRGKPSLGNALRHRRANDLLPVGHLVQPRL